MLCVILTCVLSVSLAHAQEPDTASEDPPTLEATAQEPEAVSPQPDGPISEESTESVEEPLSENSQYGWKAIQGANAIRDGEDPSAVGSELGNSATGQAAAQTLSSAVFRMVGGLSVVLALILFTYFGVRKFGKGIPALAGRQLGQVIGQVNLTRDATLFYVRTGGRVLVISLSSGEVRTIAEFDESAFAGEMGESIPHKGFEPERFVEELKEQSASFKAGHESEVSDDDMTALRSDIHRLQEYLQEETRDRND